MRTPGILALVLLASACTVREMPLSPDSKLDPSDTPTQEEAVTPAAVWGGELGDPSYAATLQSRATLYGPSNAVLFADGQAGFAKMGNYCAYSSETGEIGQEQSPNDDGDLDDGGEWGGDDGDGAGDDGAGGDGAGGDDGEGREAVALAVGEQTQILVGAESGLHGFTSYVTPTPGAITGRIRAEGFTLLMGGEAAELRWYDSLRDAPAFQPLGVACDAASAGMAMDRAGDVAWIGCGDALVRADALGVSTFDLHTSPTSLAWSEGAGLLLALSSERDALVAIDSDGAVVGRLSLGGEATSVAAVAGTSLVTVFVTGDRTHTTALLLDATDGTLVDQADIGMIVSGQFAAHAAPRFTIWGAGGSTAVSYEVVQ